MLSLIYLFFLLIASLLYTSVKWNFKRVHFIYGLLLTVLLTILILLFGGVHGFAKFNYFASIYFIVMVYGGKNLKSLLTLNFLMLIAVLVIGIISPPWLTFVDFGSSYSRLDFWFTLVILSSFSLYLKWITISKGKELSAVNLKMAEQVKESTNLSDMLQQVNIELIQTKELLENEVNIRTETLATKKKSTEAFIRLNNTELIDTVDDLLHYMRNVKSSSQYADNLRISSEELAAVVDSIRISLKENGWLDRRTLRSNGRKF